MSTADMDAVSLVVRTKSGATYTTPIRAGTDVIFLSKMSIDSIFIPYYQGRGDTAQVRMLRNRLSRP